MGNFLWMFAGSGAESVLKIVVLLVLARLLTPEDFGLVSAALTVVALAEVTGRIGVAPFIIQIRTLTREHVATGLTATVAIGVLLAGLIYLLAEPISRLYRLPELQPFVEVFALLFVIKGLGLVSEALLQRELRFPRIAVITLMSYIIGPAIVAVTLAVLGFGAWALVIGQLVQQVIATVCYLLSARKDLTLGFSWSTFVSMFRFGFGMTLVQIGSYIAQNGDYFIVARTLGADALGYYSRAYLLLQQASALVGRMGDKVLFPTLATIQDDRKRLQRALNRALSLVAMTQVPMTALLVILAPEIILVLMGPQWGPAVVPFQFLIVVLFFRTAYQFVGSILKAAGRVYIAAAWRWAHATAVILGAVIGQEFGLPGVAIGVSVAVVFCHLSGLAIVNYFINVSAIESSYRLLTYIGMAVGFAVILFGAKTGLELLGLGQLAVLLLVSALFTALYTLLLSRAVTLFGEEGEVLKQQILSRLNKKLGRKS
jgi:PST family polysaccharide transporter